MQLKSVQFLRFVAVTAVVLFHSWGTGKAYLGSGTGILDAFRVGEYGVDLFFVISGFIICYAFSGRTGGAGDFAWRRIIRIVPIYWFYTFAILALMVVVPAAFSGSPGVNAAHAMKSLLFISFVDGVWPVIYVGWTLEYEAFFYCAVAIMLFLGRENWLAIASAMSVLVLAGTMLPVTDHPVLEFSTRPLLLEFALGVLIALHLRGQKLGWVAPTLVIAALAATALVNPTNRAIVAGVPAAALVLGSVRVLHNLDWSRARLPLLLGDASYSIYLVQVLSISAFYKVLSTVWPTAPLELGVAGSAAATLGMGAASYLAVERPALTLLKSIRLRRTPDSA